MLALQLLIALNDGVDDDVLIKSAGLHISSCEKEESDYDRKETAEPFAIDSNETTRFYWKE